MFKRYFPQRIPGYNEPKDELTKLETFIEWAATLLCFFILMAFFAKVVFL